MSYNFLKTPYLYRYIRSDNELNFVKKNGIIYSFNPIGTYWTTLLTSDPKYAQQRLSLPEPPLYRIGGFMLKDIDPNYIKYKGTVAPAYGQIGGTEEVVLAVPIPILSIFDMKNKNLVSCILK